MDATIDKILADFIKDYNIKIEALTRDQTASAIKQAIKSGDLQRFVSVHGQAVVYIPFAEKARLELRIQELEAEIKRLS